MKVHISLSGVLLALIWVGSFHPAQAQILEKLGKRAKKSAERTVERRVDQEVQKKTDQALDSILEPGQNEKKSPTDGQQPTSTDQPAGTETGNPTAGPKTLEVYSKFDFVAGDETLFFDDFGEDFVGDLPAKWNTNGGGEVVTLSDIPGQWYAITNKSITVPNLADGLPEDYTIEFDVKAVNLTRQTSSIAKLEIYLSETPNLNLRENFAATNLNFCQYIAIGVEVYNRFQGDPDPIRNKLGRDLRQVYQDIVHVSIAVNKNRYRIWLNESKIADIPQFIKDPSGINYFKLGVKGFDAETRNEQLLISNLKIAKGGVDLRRELIAKGKISTNGILFDSGSDKIRPESMGVIRQIYQVLQREGEMSLKIVGHTDSDGSVESNNTLSQKRAEAVKNALVSVYGIDAGRLSTEGKGESEPVADNGSSEGKAQNRRVEFIKM